MAAQTCWADEVPTVNHNAPFDAEDSASAQVGLESNETVAAWTVIRFQKKRNTGWKRGTR
jgi:hypothetical protein